MVPLCWPEQSCRLCGTVSPFLTWGVLEGVRHWVPQPVAGKPTVVLCVGIRVVAWKALTFVALAAVGVAAASVEVVVVANLFGQLVVMIARLSRCTCRSAPAAPELSLVR
jgi:hypothetical protein